MRKLFNWVQMYMLPMASTYIIRKFHPRSPVDQLTHMYVYQGGLYLTILCNIPVHYVGVASPVASIYYLNTKTRGTHFIYPLDSIYIIRLHSHIREVIKN